MRAEGFTRWDAFLRFNSPPRKQVNPLMTQEQEQQLSQTMLAMMQSGGDAPKSTVEVPVYAWRLIRWEADVPLTEEQRQEALAIVPEAMALCGVSAACFAADGDVMTVLLALTRFPARAHRDPVLWLCAHALMEQASVALEQDGTMFIGEEFDLAATWAEHLKPMREISDWWTRVSPLDGAAAHRHRKELQTCIKRRQYAVLGGYVSRALREDQNLSVTCFAFVPLVIEAIWSQHAELSLRTLTEGLNLNEMTRRPRQALLAWLNALQPSLCACPQPGNAKPIEKVIDSIRADCSLPYSQANLSRSLGLTPAYFCRLFHEKTGQHFSTFLTRTRMEKAQMMLSSKEPQTLGEISAACGYPNKSYFCQVFKKYTGMTPGEYQAMAKEK